MTTVRKSGQLLLTDGQCTHRASWHGDSGCVTANQEVTPKRRHFRVGDHSSRIAGSATRRGNNENVIGRGQRKDRILCSFEITNAIGYKRRFGVEVHGQI